MDKFYFTKLKYLLFAGFFALCGLASAQVYQIEIGAKNPFGVTNDGTVSLYDGGGNYIWTEDGGLVTINTFGAGHQNAGQAQISADGSKIAATVTNPDSDLDEMGLYDVATDTWTYLGGLGASSGNGTSSAWSISGDGSTVVGLGWVSAGSAHAIKWTAYGGLVDMGSTVAGSSSRANDVSSDGSIIVGWQDSSTGYRQGAIWENGTQTLITDGSGNPVGEIGAISGNGEWAIGGGLNFEAWRYNLSTGVIEAIPDDNADQFYRGSATAISDDGSVIVGFYRNWPGPAYFGDGFIWTEATGKVDINDYLADLGIDDLGIDFSLPLAVSPDGTAIAGTGVKAGGQIVSFMIKLPSSGGGDDEGTACGQDTPSNNFETGVGSFANYIITNDFVVNGDETSVFSVDSISFNAFVNPGETISSVDVVFYDDSNNSPGDVIMTLDGLVPTEVNVIGQTQVEDIGTMDVLQVSINLDTPIDFQGVTGQSIYWLGLQVPDYTGDNIKMELVSTLDTPNDTYINLSGTWYSTSELFGVTRDGVFGVYGTCTASDACSAVVSGAIDGPSSVCSGIGFSLSVSGATVGGTGLTYQWESSPADQDSWTVISDADGITLNVVDGITQPTKFRFTVECANSGNSETTPEFEIGLNSALECYCIPDYSSGCGLDDIIDDFTLMGENGTSIEDVGTGCSPNAYDDRTDESVDLLPGSTYSIAITAGTSGDYVAVWIDLNNDGAFDSSERLGFSATGSASPDYAIDFDIDIPADAPDGPHRMRVMLTYDSSGDVPTDACVPDGSWGEVHDYTATILEGTPVGGDCSQEQISNNFEDFIPISNPMLVANDMIVEQYLSNFELDSIVANIASPSGIASADITFYEDSNGIPGDQIGTVIEDLVPSSTIDMGTAIGGSVTVEQTTFILPEPVDFAGNNAGDTRYWVQIQATPNTTTGPPAFLEITSVNQVGESMAYKNPSDADFALDGVSDGVISFYGDCTTAQEDCAAPSDIVVDNNGENEIDISWTPGGNETEWEVVYGVSGTFDVDAGEGTYVSPNPTTPEATLTGIAIDTQYDVYVRAVCDGANGIYSEWTFATVNNDISVDSQIFEGFTYYPNPVESQLTLDANTPIQQVELYNLLGQVVIGLKPNTLQTQIKSESLQSGVYLMKVTLKGVTKTFRIVKK